jgi:hypothetical protein
VLSTKSTIASSVRAHAHSNAIHILSLAALPLLLVLLNDFWAYTSTQAPFIDPWFYLSYFLHLKTQLLAFPQVYFGDRISYNVPGWLLFQLLGPWLGNYVLRLLVIYIAIFSLYFAVLRLFDRRTALVSAGLLVVSPYFLAAFGWSYTDGPAIAYYALSLYLIVRAATSDRWRLAMVGSGACATLCVGTHFLYLNLIWTLPLGFLLFTWDAHRDRIWKGLVAFGAGVAAAFAACCAVYYTLTGRWFYLANSVNHTLHGFKPAQEVNRPVGAWIGVSSWLIHYNVMLAIVLWLLLKRSLDRRQRVCMILFGVSYVTIWLWQSVGFPFAMISFYASFLFPVYLLALASVIRDPIQCLSPIAYRALTAVVLLIGSALIFSSRFLDRLSNAARAVLEHDPTLSGFWSNRVLWLSLLGIAICWPCAALWKRREMAFTGFMVGMLFVGSTQLTFMGGAGWFAPAPGSDYTNKEGHRLILEADAWLQQQIPDRHLLLWYDASEHGGAIFTGLSSLYIDLWSLVNARMPLLSPEDLDRIHKEPNVVLVSWNRRKIDAAIQALQSKDWAVEKRIDNTVRRGSLELHMALVSLEPAALHQPGMQELTDLLRPEAIGASTPARVSRRNDGIDFVTGTERWLYDGSLALDSVSIPGERPLLKISAKVLRGDVNFGILRATGAFGALRQLHPSSKYQNVVLELGEDSVKKAMIISNATFGGQPAEVLIDRIEVCVPADSTLARHLRDSREHSKIQ